MFHVKFADIGEGIHEGVVLKMPFQKGDAVKEGDTLFTLETDKVNADIPSPVSGTMADVRFKVGDKVHVGQVIVVIDDGEPGMRSNMQEGEALNEGGGDITSAKTTESVSEDGSTAVVGEIEVSSDVIASSDEVNASQTTAAEQSGRVLATPVARKMAKDLGVDIKQVIGTGPQGRVMKADIQKAHDLKQETPQQPQAQHAQAKAPAYVPTAGANIERVKMTMLRKTIAANMSLSKFTIPHTAVMDEIDATELVAFRERVKHMAKEEGVKLTYLAFFVKALIKALKAYPYLNASIDEANDEIVLKYDYNIGIAVDTAEGLMVPVIKHADRLSIFEIATAIEDLSYRAREKTLKLEELTGGTFTITNYGAVGASFGVPVIKHPEAGILGVGTIVKKPVVIEDDIVIRSILPVSLSFDHRIIDGADAGRFVGVLKALLSNPERLLLS